MLSGKDVNPVDKPGMGDQLNYAAEQPMAGVKVPNGIVIEEESTGVMD